MTHKPIIVLIVLVILLVSGIIISTAMSYTPHESPCEYRIPEQKRVCK